MKWIFLSLFILTHSPLWAAEQFTKAQCDRLKQQKELVRKRLNAGYGFAEGEQLDKQDRELFQKIASHCTSPVADSETRYEIDDAPADDQETSPNQRPATTKYANVSLQEMPSQAKHQPIQNVVTAYTVEPTTTDNPPPSASRYVENIRQQFNWVGMAIIGILAALSWLIWRKL